MLRNLNRRWPGGRIIGTPKTGVRGSLIPTDTYIAPSLALPAENDDEFQGYITSVPAGLSLQTEEDGSMIASGPDGVYTVPWDLYKNGKLVGSTFFEITWTGEGIATEAAALNSTQSAATSGGTLNRSVIEASVLAESAGALVARSAALAEGINAADTVAALAAGEYARSIAEAAALADTANASAPGNFAGALTEPAAADDAPDASTGLAAALVEPAAAADEAFAELPGVYHRGIIEASAADATSSAARALLVDITESSPLLDLTLINWPYLAGIEEAAALGDWCNAVVATPPVYTVRDYSRDFSVMTIKYSITTRAPR